MKQNAVCWFEIYVNDIARAKTFYATVLDVPLTELNPVGAPSNGPKPEMWAFPMNELPGASGAICKMEGVEAGANSTMVYFSCADCSVEASRVDAAGGTLVAPKMSLGEHGFIAVAQDPDGNNIGLHSEA